MLMVDEMEEETGNLLSALTPPAAGGVPHAQRGGGAEPGGDGGGRGAAAGPDLPALELEGDRIESRDVSGALPVVQVGIVWRRGAPLSAAAREFIAMGQGARR
jgi:hypothetical protein